MKKVKIICKIVLFCTIFIGAQWIIKYVTLDDTNTISRVMMHDLYTQEDNIDILFCGASHCQLGFDVAVLDKGFKVNTFNAGSSSQGLETTLAIIKEAEKHYDLKQVYVDLDYSIVMRDMPNLESIYIVSDYMKPSFRKVSHLLNATSFDYYVNSFMPLHKGRGYTKNPKKIIDIVKKKSTIGYRDFLEVDPSYAGKGHIASKTVVEEGALWTPEGFVQKDFNIPDKQKEYLHEIITFCNREDIQLTFVSVPVTDFHLALIQNYDEYVTTINTFLAEYQVPYYDFNLCKPETLALQSNTYYNDDNHLNLNGANKFCEVFSAFFTGKIEKEDLFYDSYEQKMGACNPKVLGLIVQNVSDSADALTEVNIEVIPVVNGEIPEVVCEVQQQEEGYEITASVNGVITNKVQIKDEELK